MSLVERCEMNGGVVMDEKWTDSELLLKIKQEDNELWSALIDLAKLYRIDAQKTEMVIEDIVACIRNVK
ncbi:hypothetical protein [Bacillus cytotoxicus]|uniref:hypothetical protein n=2 Tax=Bacillus cytotoxicus TaxID=580165 RepID=UPI000B970F2B|nr:hypothetical protein CG474_000015 [Bacillus cytotoxicus]